MKNYSRFRKHGVTSKQFALGNRWRNMLLSRPGQARSIIHVQIATSVQVEVQHQKKFAIFQDLLGGLVRKRLRAFDTQISAILSETVQPETFI